VLPLISKEIFMHVYTYGEVMRPLSAVCQLNDLLSEEKVILVSESDLTVKERVVYDATYKNLSKVMLDPTKPYKNKGELCALSYAKAVSIPVFATDERDLQPIIDKQLNTGMNDITCIRIVDIVNKAKSKEMEIPRKIAKALWVVSGKKKEIFDTQIWPLEAG
ncbi:MAG: hypothetical protein LUE86_14270, partial [Clostridiales bacterium]|nr:hypothetical protein [Clostridiales bacterium]